MPTLPHTTYLYGVDEAAIYPMLTDVAGSAPTYSAKIPIPGINTITPNFDITSKELFGDNRVLGRASKVRQAMMACTYARLSLDVLNILSGGTTTDAGTTPAQTSTFSLLPTATPGYFKFECRILGTEEPGPAGGGDVHFVLYKCKAIDFAPVAAKEDFGMQTLNVGAVYPYGTKGLFETIINETAVALPS